MSGETIGDIRVRLTMLDAPCSEVRPTWCFNLAAQPLVRDS
jgi:hypothetical protein